jgi:hypothetical protein
MPRTPRRLLVTVLLAGACVALAAPAAPASVRAGGGLTYKGALQFEGLAAVGSSKNCHGEGAFGVAKPGARVTVSEQDASGDFTVIAKGKLAKGKQGEFLGDEVCIMKYKAKATQAPASDSRIYVEWKGLTFNVSDSASNVVDGDFGTYTCEYSDNTCAVVVGD